MMQYLSNLRINLQSISDPTSLHVHACLYLGSIAQIIIIQIQHALICSFGTSSNNLQCK